jgi:glycosyltransferase involved in cell wall biosynthesis
MKKKIVHVTEAFGGGVLHCIALLANRQVQSGADVVIIHSIRPDTPAAGRLDALLDSRIKRRVIPFRTEIGMHDLTGLARLMIRLMLERADVVHLHSSKAGALGRIAARLMGNCERTVYSPHGFAFLRKDIGSRRALALLAIERWLHRLGGVVIGCSRSEARYATMLFSSRRVSIVENAIDLSRIVACVVRNDGSALTVCTSARVTYQKAPWRFSILAASLATRCKARFVWLGGGDAQAVDAWIDSKHVQLSGWIDADALHRQLASADVFVLPSLWEGMPIALIEAQAAGLPAVASRIVGNRDVIVHGVTGFLANSDQELSAYTQRLIDDHTLRATMSVAARRHAFARFNSELFFDGFDNVYELLPKKLAYHVRNGIRTVKMMTQAKGFRQ